MSAASRAVPRRASPWDAVETREHLRKKDVSAEEVVREAIERARAAEDLGAIVEATYDRALERASSGGPLADSPFAGVPTFVKDLARVAGVRTTWGSRGSGGHVSRRSDPFVGRLEEAGLVVLGKSATPEFGLTATTEPLGRPPCRNPWDPSRSTGGSSGGAACLVAAGVVPLAHGSDGGGSIRIPASCCGLVGLKPSRRRLDMEGSNLLPVNIACDGVLTRTVRDTVAFYDAIESRRAPRRCAPIGSVAERPPRPLRIGVFVESPTKTPVDAAVKEGVRAAGRLCQSLGHEVDEIPCPFDASVNEDFLRYWGFIAWIQVRTARVMLHARFDTSKIEPWTRGMTRYFTSARLAAVAATRRLRAFRSQFDDRMRRHDVLVSPTVAAPAPPLGYLATDLPFETHFARVRTFAAFTCVYNAAGAPAISLPLGRSAEGLPIGVQFAAGRGEDRVLLELARSIEASAPWALVGSDS